MVETLEQRRWHKKNQRHSITEKIDEKKPGAGRVPILQIIIR